MKNSVPSHQTVRLLRGKHASPREGVCVMELASMLAGEPFSDHPQCVSPAIGGFLRAYNDFIDDRLRQDLYALASAVVGTRSTAAVERRRVRRVLEWGRDVRASRRLSGLARAVFGLHVRSDEVTPDEAGSFAVRAIGRHAARTHSQALALVGDLIAYGQPAGTDSRVTFDRVTGQSDRTRARGVTT